MLLASNFRALLGCHVTHDGNAGGACCHFPFVYRDSVYDRCTKSLRDNRIWCATTVDYDRDGQWGYCQGKKGYRHIAVPRLLTSSVRNACSKLLEQVWNKLPTIVTSLMDKQTICNSLVLANL